MSVVNTETVVMMGAALAAAGNVQGQEAVRTGERTIGWNEAKDVAARIQETARLRAELKAQCPDNMNEAVGKVFDGYGVDQMKDVKATLKSDGDKLNYMIDGNRFELSGGFDGKPLNTEIFGRDGSRVQNSQGETRSSTVLYDADGNMAADVQKDERTGNVTGGFRGDDAGFRGRRVPIMDFFGTFVRSRAGEWITRKGWAEELCRSCCTDLDSPFEELSPAFPQKTENDEYSFIWSSGRNCRPHCRALFSETDFDAGCSRGAGGSAVDSADEFAASVAGLLQCDAGSRIGDRRGDRL